MLAAIAHKQTHGHLRVLDAMTGCGVRPLRYALEAQADQVWANEGNPDLGAGLQTNLSRALSPARYRLTHQDANAVFFDCHQRQDFYDLIDIDSFGSPMPTLSTALWAVKLGGLVYLTSTDGRATSGRAPDSSLKTYGAWARSHPAVHEQGLRLLIGAIAQQAAAKGLTAQPVFSFYKGEVNRVMARITRDSGWRSDRFGFLAYCHACGQFQPASWQKLGRIVCPCATDEPLSVSGPMWLGPLHNQADLAAMQRIALERKWPHCQRLIATMQAEADLPPYFYPLAEIGRRGKMDIPPCSDLISLLRQQGFMATRTHFSTQALKTDAPITDCIRIAQLLAQPDSSAR